MGSKPVKGDDEVGSTRIPLKEIIAHQYHEGWYSIEFMGKHVGQVQLKFIYNPMTLQQGQPTDTSYQQSSSIPTGVTMPSLISEQQYGSTPTELFEHSTREIPKDARYAGEFPRTDIERPLDNPKIPSEGLRGEES